MRYFSDVVSDKYGNAQTGVSVTVKLNGANATIYSDRGVTLTNPVTSDSSGVISFYYPKSGTYTFWVAGAQVGSVYLQDDIVNVVEFGAVGDGVTDDSVAIAAAHATGRKVFYPAVSDCYLCNSQIDLTQGGMIGEQIGTGASALRSMIKFGGGISTRGAVITKIATQIGRPEIRDMYIKAASWDAIAGVQCNGLDIEAPIYLENVVVDGFYLNGAFFHNDASGNGPYESYARNLKCIYNRQHGIVVGTGANVITFINPEGKWNGAPSYGVAPSVAGNYDGFFISNAGDGNPGSAYFSYVPEALTIIGGDCGYNSRYGWNFSAFTNSASVYPGYAEGNLVGSSKQARIGDISKVYINFGAIAGGATGLQNDFATTANYPAVRVFIAGQQVFNGNLNYNMIAGSGVAQTTYLTTNTSDSNSFAANSTPDGTALASSGYGSVVTLGGGGSFAWGLGSGSHHMNISASDIRLPQVYRRKTSTGWNSAVVVRSTATAMPASGTFTAGDYYENVSPSVLGSAGSKYVILGWMRLTTGSNNVLNTDWVECHALTGA